MVAMRQCVAEVRSKLPPVVAKNILIAVDGNRVPQGIADDSGVAAEAVS